jgi:glutamate racemase
LHQPIGIFDSGIGGLSILRALRTALTGERFIYVADSGHAPYGERADAHVVDRSLRIASYLVSQNIKVLVVACNTATAAAIDVLRAT